jgi:xanthosine utilization system XapX-like protein
VAATAAGLLVAAHLAFGPVAVARALAKAGEQHSRSSVWRLAFDAGPDRWVGIAAIAAGIAVGAVLARRHLADPTPEVAVASALIGYLLLGSYVLPWYHAWVLLPAALAWRHRLGLGAAVASAVLLLGYTWNPADHGPVAVTLREVSHWGAPAVALAVALLLLRPRPAHPDP